MKKKITIVFVVLLLAIIGVYAWHSQRVKPPAKSTVAPESTSAKLNSTTQETSPGYDPTDKGDPSEPLDLDERPQQEEGVSKVSRQLTPLQKMPLSEIQAGLRAIIWGGLGKKALVEDATGKGYVVDEGTFVGQHNGIVKRIYEDRIVVEEYRRDPTEDRLVPSEVVLKLKKGDSEQ